MNHSFCCILILRYDILDISSKCSLNSDLIVFFNLHDICYYTQKSLLPVLIIHDFTNTVTVSVIAFSHISKRLQA